MSSLSEVIGRAEEAILGACRKEFAKLLVMLEARPGEHLVRTLETLGNWMDVGTTVNQKRWFVPHSGHEGKLYQVEIALIEGATGELRNEKVAGVNLADALAQAAQVVVMNPDLRREEEDHYP